MIARLAGWLDDRLGASRAAHSALNKVFPEHWSFLLGEIAAYSFVVLVVTGIFLALFFDASLTHTTYEGSYAPLRGTEMTDAYASVLNLSFDVRGGLLMRQTHHWAALVFVGAIALHLMRVFFTGAFRRPRELNWVVGLTLLLLAILNGFTGYSLLDDLLSGTGLRIGFSIAESIPVVGTWLAFLGFGGEYPGDVIIGRLFTTHVFIVPLLLFSLLGVHLALVWRQKHTHFPAEGRTEDNVVGQRMWPTYAAKATGLFFLVGAVLLLLGGLAQINPVWLYGPYEPDIVTFGAQPDWYMGWLEGALRLMPAWRVAALGYEIPNSFFPAVLLPGVVFGAMYAYPFLEQRWTGEGDREHHVLDRPRDRPARTGFGVAAFTFLFILFLAGSNDIYAEIANVSVHAVTNVLRVALVVLPPAMFLVTRRIAADLRAEDERQARRDEIRAGADGTGPAG